MRETHYTAAKFSMDLTTRQIGSKLTTKQKKKLTYCRYYTARFKPSKSGSEVISKIFKILNNTILESSSKNYLNMAMYSILKYYFRYKDNGKINMEAKGEKEKAGDKLEAEPEVPLPPERKEEENKEGEGDEGEEGEG